MAENCLNLYEVDHQLMGLNTIYMLVTANLGTHISLQNSRLVYPTAYSVFSFECLMGI